MPAYQNFEQKMQDAERYQREDGIAWTVLVDDLEGTTHQVYGGLADPTYLIGTDGRVAFYNMWTHAPTLHEALEELQKQGWRGEVKGGVHQMPHLLPSMTDGWKGLRRGWPQSFIDLETSAPGMASGPWLGYQLRPLLAPLTLRSKPLPPSAKLGLAAGAAALLFLGARSLMSRSAASSRKGQTSNKRL
ncbi:MAG: hypothetical protein H0U18_14060 [Pyrinomonadaceae bacterium]|nr:hypothetical protein [Pyrinomonadaceae bacterium]